MTIFLMILAVYLLSAVALYFVTKFMYLRKHPSTLAPVWAWITPGINTILALTGFLLCWNYFPVTGLDFWKKRWDPKQSPLDKIQASMENPSIDIEMAQLVAAAEAAGTLRGGKKKLISDPDSRV